MLKPDVVGNAVLQKDIEISEKSCFLVEFIYIYSA